MKTKIPQVSKKVEPLLLAIKSKLSDLYGDNLHQLVLYGSYARGKQHNESDIDLLLILNTMISPYHEVAYMNDITAELTLEHDIFFSVIPTTYEKFNTMENPLYENIKKDGVII